MTEFAFKPTKEQIDRFRKLTPEQKLEWLEEVNEFIYKFVPKEKRERWRRYIGKT